MKRFLLILALGGIVAAGCGDDDGDDDDTDTPDAGDGGTRPDGSVSDGGMDAGRPDSGVDAAAAKVSNPGAACTTATASTACMGPMAICSPVIGFGATAPGGGFCTATCTASAQCGDNGSCPFGDLLNNPTAGNLVREGFNDAGVPNVALDMAQKCFQRCATTGMQSTCATGYKCSSLVLEFPTLQAAAGLVPSIQQGICIPTTGLAPVPGPGDAGAGDAGTGDAAVVQGMDSGL